MPTGLKLAIPEGFEAQVRARSGLALKQGLAVANAPGTIDADYRGEVGVILVNLGDAPVRIERGMRIAQLVVAPVVRARWVPVDVLPTHGPRRGRLRAHGDVARRPHASEAPSPRSARLGFALAGSPRAYSDRWGTAWRVSRCTTWVRVDRQIGSAPVRRRGPRSAAREHSRSFGSSAGAGAGTRRPSTTVPMPSAP